MWLFKNESGIVLYILVLQFLFIWYFSMFFQWEHVQICFNSCNWRTTIPNILTPQCNFFPRKAFRLLTLVLYYKFSVHVLVGTSAKNDPRNGPTSLKGSRFQMFAGVATLHSEKTMAVYGLTPRAFSHTLEENQYKHLF